MRKRLSRRSIAYLVLGVVTLAVASLTASECSRRRQLYWYDVGRDYAYRFSGESVQRVQVQLDSDGFDAPQLKGKWDTALLEIDVRSGLLGRWYEPYMSISQPDSGTTRQYFERGAAGTRYVNLGSLFADTVAGVQRIELAGKHLSWRPQGAALLLFRNPDPDDARILVVAPHPDDAEIAAFGLYARRDSWIVTITHGSYRDTEYDRFFEDDTSRYRFKAQMRNWDSRVVPWMGDVAPERNIQLGYSTLALEAMHASPNAIVPDPVSGSTDVTEWREWNALGWLAERDPSPTWRSLVQDLEAVVREVRPEIIVAPHPSLDGSSDHAYSTLALFEALDGLRYETGMLFLYVNHHALSHYYPYGPVDAQVTLPPWFDDRLPFRGVYSLPLTELRRTEKLFALEAMHDLRRKPEWELGGTGARIVRRIRSAVSELIRDPARELSFFRRAPRPNELFFVYPTSDRQAIADAFLTVESPGERRYR